MNRARASRIAPPKGPPLGGFAPRFAGPPAGGASPPSHPPMGGFAPLPPSARACPPRPPCVAVLRGSRVPPWPGR